MSYQKSPNESVGNQCCMCYKAFQVFKVSNAPQVSQKSIIYL